MQNYILNTDTGIHYETMLSSEYSRQIIETPTFNVGYVKYILNNTQYCDNNTNYKKTWKFAENATFFSCLYCIPDENLKNSYFLESEKQLPIPSLDESFSNFPKLPSVYLLAMQAIDIISFDAFLSMANTNLDYTSFSIDFKTINELSYKNIPIGVGIYSNSSFYLNNKLNMRVLGESLYKNRTPCWIIDFLSEPSDVYVENEKLKSSQNSKSIYSGLIYISKKNGDILFGEINENIIPIKNNKKYTKRKISLEKIPE